jgi:hypothetical protein
MGGGTSLANAKVLGRQGATGGISLCPAAARRGADVRRVKAGATPLVAAEKNGFAATAKLLRQHGGR